MSRKLLILTLLSVSAAHTATIMAQGPPNDNATNIVDFRLADDFSLAQSATITGISFWYQAQFQEDLSSLAYAFYTDSGGALGSTLLSGVAVPQLSMDGNAFFATFSIASLSLTAGTYWLELHGGSSLTDNTGFAIFWAATSDNSTALARISNVPVLPGANISQSGFQQYAFALEGRTTTAPEPEPATALLLSCGFVLTLRLRHAVRPSSICVNRRFSAAIFSFTTFQNIFKCFKMLP